LTNRGLKYDVNVVFAKHIIFCAVEPNGALAGADAPAANQGAAGYRCQQSGTIAMGQ
jgi:hypothetical protein